MPSTRRSRSMPTTPEKIWKVVSDPHHMSRWWPEVTRVEGVADGRFTLVFISKRGRTVRADYLITEAERPTRQVWEQELVDTPFEKVLSELIVSIDLEPDENGTLVTLAQEQKMRGYGKTGGFMVKRAAAVLLDQALESLEQIFIV